ncbi:MAG: universal stress protein [Alphaproteobacteria bacterium]|nr:universal stress protein [Alphaproteobacteria bacterium]
MARPRLAEGAELDGFTIGRMIHAGGMAMLYEVTRAGESGTLLMKTPRLLEGEDPAAIVSFEMEQMIMPRLSGPHVPRFLAAGDFATMPYIVMERLPAPSLYAQLEKLPLPAEQVAGYGAAIADALDALHRQHVVHLDVKPSNVMFRPSGEAVLIDFGLAHHDQLPDLMQEEFRLPYGTAPYMAPEQVMGMRSEPRSDLFALGSLMYFFATGERPFGDPQRLKGLKRRLWRDPVPPRRRRPELPAWFQEIVLRCLEVDPALRHPTAAQLAFELRHPDQIVLTARAEKAHQDGFMTVMRRRFAREPVAPLRRPAAAQAIAAAPIVAVAIDLAEGSAELANALRSTVLRVLDTSPDARVACLNVLKLNRIALDTTLDAQGHNKHLQRLVELRHWAEPLRLAEGQASFHVLEAVDPAGAILEYARANRVDHVVMGARANSTARRLLGSVSGEVAAQAPCTVTVVRNRSYAAEA